MVGEVLYPHTLEQHLPLIFPSLSFSGSHISIQEEVQKPLQPGRDSYRFQTSAMAFVTEYKSYIVQVYCTHLSEPLSFRIFLYNLTVFSCHIYLLLLVFRIFFSKYLLLHFFLHPLSGKSCIRYCRSRYNNEQELVLAMRGTDDPMGEVDQHVFNIRKWLFRFLFGGQAFCKVLGYVCARLSQLVNWDFFKKALHCRKRYINLVIVPFPIIKTYYF